MDKDMLTVVKMQIQNLGEKVQTEFYQSSFSTVMILVVVAIYAALGFTYFKVAKMTGKRNIF